MSEPIVIDDGPGHPAKGDPDSGPDGKFSIRFDTAVGQNGTKFTQHWSGFKTVESRLHGGAGKPKAIPVVKKVDVTVQRFKDKTPDGTFVISLTHADEEVRLDSGTTQLQCEVWGNRTILTDPSETSAARLKLLSVQLDGVNFPIPAPPNRRLVLLRDV